MRAIICNLGLWTLAFAAGAGALFQFTPRELSQQEKQALHGGNDTYASKCCQPIPNCDTLPSNHDCAWFTTGGKLFCFRGEASEYELNGNDKSCTGDAPAGTTCTLGDAAPCILVSGCYWDNVQGQCVSYNDWTGSQPGYDSCGPNCPT
jgi:hypothetical protein